MGVGVPLKIRRPWSTMRIILTFLLLLAFPLPGLAQSVRSMERAAPVPTPPPLHLDASQQETPTLAKRLLRVVSGAAVGAWVGYMASQVAVGDWDDDPGIHRGSWAASGAALGVTLGLTVPGGRRPPARAAGPRAERPGRDVLTTEQLRRSRSGNLYDVIRSLRPEWLQTRGTGSMRETPRGSASGIGGSIKIEQPGIPTIRAYLDDSLLGDAEELRSVDPGMVGEVRFLGAAEATHRYGAGHIHGAILVLTASSQ